MENLKIIKDDPSFTNGRVGKDEDAFDHQAFAKTIFHLIEDNDPPLTVGLFGSWGVGKSSIVNLVRAECKKHNLRSVYFNAWQYSGDSFRRQFLLTVASSDDIVPKTRKENEISRLQTLSYQDVKKGTKQSLKLDKAGLSRLGIFLIVAAAAIFLIIHGGWERHQLEFGIGTVTLLASLMVVFVQQLQQIIQVDVDTIVDPQLLFPEQFTEEFHKLIKLATEGKDKSKIVIVIDDLDRCDIETIKNVLVSLKTFLGHEKCIFIIPMDDSSVVRMFRGENTNFGYEQLRKYFSVALRIPPIHQEDLLHFARRISTEYDIPASVVYIAAVGYCQDARKIKHFLNMFKLKYALAEERINAGFLRDIDLEKSSEQLAKIVVLEYQYPEFFRNVSTRPEWMTTIGRAACDIIDKEELNKILWKEFGEKIDNLEDLWHAQPGLKEFLRATDTVPMDNFDLLLSMKTSSQEHFLGEFGSRLIKYIEGGEQFKSEDYLSDDYLNANGRVIVDSITRWLIPDVPVAARRAYTFALTILTIRKLNESLQEDLSQNVFAVLVNPRVGLLVAAKDAAILLDNFDLAGWNQRVGVSKKIVTDLFTPDRYNMDAVKLLSHKNLRAMLSSCGGDAKDIDAVLQKWYSDLKSIEEKTEFVKAISVFPLSKEERLSTGLICPSNALLGLLVADMDLESESFDRSTLEVVTSELNPENYSEDTVKAEAKLAELVNDSLQTKDKNGLLVVACKGIIALPNYLSDTSAASLTTAIFPKFAQYANDIKARLVMLDVFLLCYLSLDDSPQRTKTLDNYYTLIDTLQPEEFDPHYARIREHPFDTQEIQEHVRPTCLARRLSTVDSEIDEPAENTLANARLCRSYANQLGDGVYDTFVDKLFATDASAALEMWSPFLLEELDRSPEDRKKRLLDNALASFKNTSISKDARTQYGRIVLEFLNHIEVALGIPYYTEFFSWLTQDDPELRRFISDNFTNLRNRFGDDIPHQKVDQSVAALLHEDNLAPFAQSVNICAKFAAHFSDATWHELSQKLISDLPNETLDILHRQLLLELAGNMQMPDDSGHDLSRVLFTYKESGDINDLKTKSWEVYERLTRLKIIPIYVAPPQDQSEQSGSAPESV